MFGAHFCYYSSMSVENPSPKSHVHIVRCPEYRRETVRQAVQECWQECVPPDFVRPGMRVLLKPNVINALPPERAVCTHPEVVRAVAEILVEAGADVLIADQPGYALTEEVQIAFAQTGLKEACGDLPVRFALLAQGGYQEVRLAQPYVLPRVQYASLVLEADRVINLPKAKTHNQTLITAAIKNMFGAMAPRQRLEVHLLGRYWALSEAIVDCYAVRVPDLHILDAVEIMEGMGPTQGQPRRMGMLIASRDGVAVDAVLQKAWGFAPEEVGTTIAAANMGLGCADVMHIHMSGLSWEQIIFPIRRSPVVRVELLGPLVKLLGRLVIARPKVIRRNCRACGACAGICPNQAITVNKLAQIDLKSCVECFCCLEACPFDAIVVRRSPVYALLYRLQKFFAQK